MKGKSEQKGNSNGHGSGHIRVRVIDLDIAGNNETLSEGLKALTSALTKSPGVATPARPSLPAAPKQTTATVLQEEEVERPEASTEAPASEDDVEEETGEETTNGNDSRQRKPRPVPRAPVFLSDMNLTTASVKLQDFMEAKKPEDTMEKYLVIAEWFREYMKIPEVTTDHIFTGYDVLGWKSQLPSDPQQPLRDLRHKKNYFDKGEKRGGYKINWHGQSAVSKMPETK